MKVLVTIGPISKTQLRTVLIAYLYNRNLDQLSSMKLIKLMTELAYSRKFKQWKNCNNYCGHPGGNLIVPFYIHIFEKNTVYCCFTILEFTLWCGSLWLMKLFNTCIVQLVHVTHYTIAICIDNWLPSEINWSGLNCLDVEFCWTL